MKFKKLFIFIIYISCIQLLGCGVIIQYTVPYEEDTEFVNKNRFPPIDVGLYANDFHYTSHDVSLDLISDNLKLYIYPTNKCRIWIFGVIPYTNVYCPFSLHACEYRIYMNIENISTMPITFYTDKVSLITQGGKIAYEIRNTDQMALDNEETQIYFENDAKNVTLMPNQNIEVSIVVGNWSNIGNKFEVDLTKAFSTHEKIKFQMERRTAVRYGLLLGH